MALVGIAVGTECCAGLSLVCPRPLQGGLSSNGGFGAMGAAAGVSAALGLDPRDRSWMRSGSPAAMAGGIIDILRGRLDQRLHAGWAAQSRHRAALLASEGFVGPRTVSKASRPVQRFRAHDEGDYEALTGDFGTRW